MRKLFWSETSFSNRKSISEIKVVFPRLWLSFRASLGRAIRATDDAEVSVDDAVELNRDEYRGSIAIEPYEFHCETPDSLYSNESVFSWYSILLRRNRELSVGRKMGRAPLPR